MKGECDGHVFLEKDNVKFLLGEGSSGKFGVPDFVEVFNVVEHYDKDQSFG